MVITIIIAVVAYVLVGSLVVFGHMCYWRGGRIYDEDAYYLLCVFVWIGWPLYLVGVAPLVGLYRLFMFLDEKSKEIAFKR